MTNWTCPSASRTNTLPSSLQSFRSSLTVIKLAYSEIIGLNFYMSNLSFEIWTLKLPRTTTFSTYSLQLYHLQHTAYQLTAYCLPSFLSSRRGVEIFTYTQILTRWVKIPVATGMTDTCFWKIYVRRIIALPQHPNLPLTTYQHTNLQRTNLPLTSLLLSSTADPCEHSCRREIQ